MGKLKGASRTWPGVEPGSAVTIETVGGMRSGRETKECETGGFRGGVEQAIDDPGAHGARCEDAGGRTPAAPRNARRERAE